MWLTWHITVNQATMEIKENNLMLFLIEYHIFYNPNIFNITFGCHR